MAGERIRGGTDLHQVVVGVRWKEWGQGEYAILEQDGDDDEVEMWWKERADEAEGTMNFGGGMVDGGGGAGWWRGGTAGQRGGWKMKSSMQQGKADKYAGARSFLARSEVSPILSQYPSLGAFPLAATSHPSQRNTTTRKLTAKRETTPRWDGNLYFAGSTLSLGTHLPPLSPQGPQSAQCLRPPASTVCLAPFAQSTTARGSGEYELVGL